MPHDKNSKILVKPRNGKIIFARQVKTCNLRNPALASRIIDGLGPVFHDKMVPFHCFSMVPSGKLIFKGKARVFTSADGRRLTDSVPARQPGSVRGMHQPGLLSMIVQIIFSFETEAYTKIFGVFRVPPPPPNFRYAINADSSR